MLGEIKFHYPLQHANNHFQPKISQCLRDSILNDSPPGVAICSSASCSCREISTQYTIKYVLIIMDKSLNIDKCLLLVFPLFSHIDSLWG